MIDRRDFLKISGMSFVQMMAGQALVTSTLLPKAEALTGLPIQALRDSLGRDGSLILVPSDSQFAAYQIAFNKRTLVMPQARVLVNSSLATQKTILWARANHVPFAIRSGGHSYEGYSQTDGVVIDVRLLNSLDYDAISQTVKIGSGANLGSVYQYLSQYDQAIPAGSCPTVGVAGHTLGGGFGLIARKYGLACDNVLAIEMVDAQGNILNVTPTENPDLFWALRGGGNGNFGIVTQFVFQTHTMGRVQTFGMDWLLSPDKALHVIQDWQRWAPQAPEDITSLFRVSRSRNGMIRLHAAGLSLGSQNDLQRELENLNLHSRCDKSSINEMSFIESVHHFAGSSQYQSVYMKAKSDYLKSPMSDQGFMTMMKSLLAQSSSLDILFDSYGGAISRVKNTDTAFAHRESTQYVLQYYTQWSAPQESAAHLSSIRSVYDSMRPFVSGSCYVNYCDLDLKNPRTAYWGANLPRLMQIKAAVDPDNLFQHAQSIRPADAGSTGSLAGLAAGTTTSLTTTTRPTAASQPALRAARPLALVYPSKSKLNTPVQVDFKLENAQLIVTFNVETPTIYSNPQMGPKQYPFMYDVVEVFVSVEPAASQSLPYYEFELSPLNQDFQVKIINPKTKMIDGINMGLEHKVVSTPKGWIANLTIPLHNLGWNGDPARLTGNAYAVLGSPGDRSYWSLFQLNEAKPNFHRPDLFQPLL